MQRIWQTRSVGAENLGHMGGGGAGKGNKQTHLGITRLSARVVVEFDLERDNAGNFGWMGASGGRYTGLFR